MDSDYDTFDPSEALVDEGRNLYYPADWQKGDPVFVLNEPDGPCCAGGGATCWHEEEAELNRLKAEFTANGGRGVELADRIDALRLMIYGEELYELEQRKGLDCE